MNQREEIEALLDKGTGYDEIEDQTGSQRSYIRSIATQHRKHSEGAEEGKIPETREEPEEPPEPPEENPSMNFVDDTPHKEEKKQSSHKEWVKTAKYECGGCGATIGKTQDFCAHCGKTLNWEGIE